MPIDPLLNPFGKKGELPKNPYDEIFQKPSKGGGGGTPKRKSDEQIQAEADKEALEFEKQEANKEPIEEPPKKEITVTLSNLKWLSDKGIFNAKCKVGGDVEIPPSQKDLTRIRLMAYALDPKGDRDRVGNQEECFAKDGKFEGELTLYYPHFKIDGETPESCQYIFTAFHTYSNGAEGPKILASEPEEIISLPDAQSIAFDITVEYETGGSYSTLTGNFDGAGLSFGSMQWNIKWGTLQKMLTRFKNADEKTFEACFGKDTVSLKKLEEIMSEKMAGAGDLGEDDSGSAQSFPKGMEWAESIQPGGMHKISVGSWVQYFKAIGDNESFQKIQKDVSISENHKRTMSKIDWMKDISPALWGKVYLKSYCALFDLCNQHQTVRKSIRHKLEKEWQTTPPTSQLKMVEALSTSVANAGTFSSQSLGRRMGILKGRQNSGTGWVSVSNKLLFTLLNKVKVIEGI